MKITMDTPLTLMRSIAGIAFFLWGIDSQMGGLKAMYMLKHTGGIEC